MLEQVPNACNAMLAALEDFLEPTQTIVLRGQPEALAEWWSGALTLRPASADAGHTRHGRRPRRFASRAASRSAPVTAYVCAGTECRSPLTTLMPWSGNWPNDRPSSRRTPILE
ncbi:MAG: hypothetical protein R3F44_01500 [Candidatus Competibacteraceae bacterium]